jgi:hypothetical protein
MDVDSESPVGGVGCIDFVNLGEDDSMGCALGFLLLF